MAYANLNTGKVYGANKGSKKYYHEIGHLKFEEEFKFGWIIRTSQDLSLKFLIFFTAFECLYQSNFFKSLIILTISIYIISEMIEEELCWKYARAKIRKKDNGESNKNKPQ